MCVCLPDSLKHPLSFRRLWAGLATSCIRSKWPRHSRQPLIRLEVSWTRRRLCRYSSWFNPDPQVPSTKSRQRRFYISHCSQLADLIQGALDGNPFVDVTGVIPACILDCRFRRQVAALRRQCVVQDGPQVAALGPRINQSHTSSGTKSLLLLMNKS